MRPFAHAERLAAAQFVLQASLPADNSGTIVRMDSPPQDAARHVLDNGAAMLLVSRLV